MREKKEELIKKMSGLENEFKAKLPPAELVLGDRASIEASKRLIQKHIDEEQYDLALDQTLKDFKISICDYKTSYEEIEGSVCGQVEYWKFLVTLDMVQMKDACFFIATVRHEAEHIQQHNRTEHACKNVSNFESSTNKERSAYLNDLLNMDRICPEESYDNLSDTLYGFRIHPEKNPARNLISLEDQNYLR